MEENIKKAFDRLGPSEEQSLRMYKKIISENVQMKGNERGRILNLKRIAVALLTVALLASMGNASFASEIIERITEKAAVIFNMNQTIVDKVEHFTYEERDGYAPDIMFLDEKYLIFGNTAGLLVYDLSDEDLIGTLDLQTIDCIYFNSIEIHTRAVIADGRLWVFNEKNGEIYREYYSYSLPDSHSEGFILEGTGNDEVVFHNLMAFLPFENRLFVNTYEYFENHNEEVFALIRQIENGDHESYSESAYPLMKENRIDSYSFLRFKENEYSLYTINEENGEYTKKIINLNTIHETGEAYETEEEMEAYSFLPAFTCSLGDSVEDAIYAYYKKNYWDVYYKETEDGICIPEFDILKREERDGETLVWALIGHSFIVRFGKMLVISGSGHWPALIYLQGGKEGYQVTHAENAGDGARYLEDIERFAEGDEVLRESLRGGADIDEKLREAFLVNLKKYITENDLSVTFLAGFKNDPVEIFGQ